MMYICKFGINLSTAVGQGDHFIKFCGAQVPNYMPSLGLLETKFQFQSLSHQTCGSSKEIFKSITINRHEGHLGN